MLQRNQFAFIFNPLSTSLALHGVASHLNYRSLPTAVIRRIGLPLSSDRGVTDEL